MGFDSAFAFNGFHVLLHGPHRLPEIEILRDVLERGPSHFHLDRVEFPFQESPKRLQEPVALTLQFLQSSAMVGKDPPGLRNHRLNPRACFPFQDVRLTAGLFLYILAQFLCGHQSVLNRLFTALCHDNLFVQQVPLFADGEVFLYQHFHPFRHQL